MTKLLAGAACLASLVAGGAIAQPYPSRPVPLVVPLAPGGSTEGPVDLSVRAAMLKRGDGLIVHAKTALNDIFITKRGPNMALSTRFRGRDYFESLVNLRDPDDLQVSYTQTILAGLVYPRELERILMVGLGAGSISTYVGRAMPEVRIDVVELDPGVVGAARQYFGLRDTERVKLLDGDGRVYLSRNRDKLYDLIILDAFYQVGVPFHLLTKEFYALVKARLTPGGAVAMNLIGGTKLYVSTIATLRAVFETVETYPEFQGKSETQVITIALPGPAPSTEALQQRAAELHRRHELRYSLTRLLAKRVAKPDVPASDVLTDDFAPVSLYETMPLRRK